MVQYKGLLNFYTPSDLGRGKGSFYDVDFYEDLWYV